MMSRECVDSCVTVRNLAAVISHILFVQLIAVK